MSLLSIIQDASNEVGVTAPTTVFGNTDLIAVQMLALANRGGKSLAKRFAWQELVKEWTFTTVATESQGLIDTIMPGFNWDLYQTIWNRTTRFEVGGPLFPDEWQFLKSLGINGPFPQFRVRGKQLLMIPIPPAGQTLAGEYVSRYWCQSAGGVGRDRWAADLDTGTLNEDLLTLDLIWRYKRAKGFDSTVEQGEFEQQVMLSMSTNGSNRTMNLGDCDGVFGGVLVPDGSWIT